MFSVSQFTTMPFTVEQDLEAYAEAGVDAIELCESKFPEGAKERRALVDAVRRSGMVVVSVQAKVHSIFPDRMAGAPASPRERLEAYKRAIGYWSDALQAPGLPFVLISGVAPEQNFREGWREAAAFVKAAAKFAESCDASVAFEPLGPSLMYHDTFFCGLDEGARLIDEAESGAAGLVADTFQLWQEHDLARRLAKLAPRVLTAHVGDWPKGGPRALDDRALPGEGTIRFAERFVGPLRAGGYAGPFTVEVLSDKSLPDSLWKQDPRALLARARAAMTPFA